MLQPAALLFGASPPDMPEVPTGCSMFIASSSSAVGGAGSIAAGGGGALATISLKLAVLGAIAEQVAL